MKYIHLANQFGLKLLPAGFSAETSRGWIFILPRFIAMVFSLGSIFTAFGGGGTARCDLERAAPDYRRLCRGHLQGAPDRL
jgi:hypothetical protein